ncbi:MAG: ABC transporter ATP-binding protein [Chitinivibrionales bacterium]|nr:ABC transporter ATP-binding protein [Chitinivibrionales bacterium]
MSQPDCVSIAGLKKQFGQAIALDIHYLHFHREAVYALVGHNGSGKTTLLRIIAGLERADAGNVSYAIDTESIGFCFQKPYMFRGTVRDNISWGVSGRSSDDVAAIDAVAGRLELGHLMNRWAKNLSAGEMQRVSFARVLARRPLLLLLDEPAANLDEQSITLMEQEILFHARSGGASIIATHLSEHAQRLSAQVVRLKHGIVVANSAEPHTEKLQRGIE